MINTVSLTAKLDAAPYTRQASTSKTVSDLVLRVPRRFPPRDPRQLNYDLIRVRCWGEVALSVQSAEAGDFVAVTGRLERDSYKETAGPRPEVIVIADVVQVVPRRVYRIPDLSETPEAEEIAR